MKNLVVTTLMLIPFALFSQEEEKIPFGDHLVPHIGMMYEFITFTEAEPQAGTLPFEESLQMLNIGVGAYYVLAHRNDVMSVGIDPSLNFGLQLIQGGVNWMAQVPVFLMGRLGSQSTSYNEQKFGIGAGVGVIYSKLSLGGPDQLGALDYGRAFINPAFVLEGNLNTNGNPVSLRLHIALSKPTFDVPFVDPLGTLQREPVPFIYNNFGFGAVYGF